MNTWRALILSGLIAWLPLSAAQDGPRSPEPRQWFLDHIEKLTAGSGSWLASNEAYRGDGEGFDAYRVRWRKGIGGRSVYGEMTGLAGGRETGVFWEFRIYWHPGEGQARIMQFSNNGIFGDGPIELQDDGSDVSVQTFYRPDGEPFRLRHVSRLEGDVHETVSFKEGPDGNWERNRSYTWRREAARP